MGKLKSHDIMTPTTFEEGVHLAINELKSILLAKRADYGPGNIERHGEYGVMVRADDKLARIGNLLKSGAAGRVEESLDDTWSDLANYAIIALMLRRGWWTLPDYRGKSDA